MSIANLLVTEIQTKFPDLKYHSDNPPEPVIIIPFPHSNSLAVEIYDDECEATICIGSFTHSHFSCYTDNITEDERHRKIVQDISDFLSDFLADKVIIWKSIDGRSGGWHYDFDLTRLPHDREYLLWSRTIAPTLKSKAKWWNPWSQKA